MLLFGHRFIKSENFYHINDIDAILKTPPNSTIYIKFDEDNLDIIEYLQNNDIPFALEIKNITQAVYAEALHAKYIILSKEMAKTIQKIAETYLFDAKIIAHITDEKEIDELAIEGIDGVVFPSAFIKVTT
jgi:hypothetical protein